MPRMVFSDKQETEGLVHGASERIEEYSVPSSQLRQGSKARGSIWNSDHNQNLAANSRYYYAPSLNVDY